MISKLKKYVLLGVGGLLGVFFANLIKSKMGG